MKVQEINAFIAQASKATDMADGIRLENDPHFKALQQAKAVVNPQTASGASLVIHTDQYRKHQNPTEHLIEQIRIYLDVLRDKIAGLTDDAQEVEVNESEFEEYKAALAQLQSIAVAQRARGASMSKFLQRQQLAKPKGGTFGVGDKSLKTIITPELEDADITEGLDVTGSKPLQLVTRIQASCAASDADDPFADMSDSDDPFAGFSEDEEPTAKRTASEEVARQVSDATNEQVDPFAGFSDDGLFDDFSDEEPDLMADLSVATASLALATQDNGDSPQVTAQAQRPAPAFLVQYADDDQDVFARPEFEAVRAEHEAKSGNLRHSWS
jgi:hypothetical protein